jgi:hypothetical protein
MVASAAGLNRTRCNQGVAKVPLRGTASRNTFREKDWRRSTGFEASGERKRILIGRNIRESVQALRMEFTSHMMLLS